MGNVNVNNLTGQNGGELVRGPRLVTGPITAIQCLDDVMLGPVLTNIDQTTDSFTNQVIPPGVIIYGKYSSVTIAQGTAILYYK